MGSVENPLKTGSSAMIAMTIYPHGMFSYRPGGSSREESDFHVGKKVEGIFSEIVRKTLQSL